MFPKDVPVILRDTIERFAATNGGKLKWTVNVCIKMCNIEPFPKGQKVVALSIVIGRVRSDGQTRCVSVERDG